MIYCVVPAPLADELFDKLSDYYRTTRTWRSSSTGAPWAGIPATTPPHADRRRRRVMGTFPAIDPPAGG